jgi:cell division protease FtsH
MQRSLFGPLGLAIVLFSLFLSLQWWMVDRLATATVSYSAFEEYARNGLFTRIISDGDDLIGELKVPSDGKRWWETARIDPLVIDRFGSLPVELQAAPRHPWLALLLAWLLPMIVLLLVWWVILRVANGSRPVGSLMGFGRARGPVRVEHDTGVRLDDVAGIDEARNELQEIIEFLRRPAPFLRLGAHIPHGVLLVGPPGTGKTLLARAVAGEAGVPFFSMGGSEFMELFVGVGAARVRDLFEAARRVAPAIVFIDELDALGRVRGFGVSAGHDEREQTLDQLLSEMDGFSPSEGIVVLAATNRPEVLDPALLRTGRFDRHVLVDTPDRHGRGQILLVHSRHVPLEDGLVMDDIAALTPGFSGADLAGLVNEAALMAARRRATVVAKQDFIAAFERMVAGIEQSGRLIPERDKRVIALHELGHALTGMALWPDNPVQKVSIIPRGRGILGHTLQQQREDRHVTGKTQLLEQIAVLLAGRAAELLCTGEASSGAADDLARASDIAAMMVMDFGMVDTVGLVTLRPRRMMLPVSDPESGLAAWGSDTASRAVAAMQSLLDEGLAIATAILVNNRTLLERLALDLQRQETLDETHLAEVSAVLVRSQASPGVTI